MFICFYIYFGFACRIYFQIFLLFDYVLCSFIFVLFCRIVFWSVKFFFGNRVAFYTEFQYVRRVNSQCAWRILEQHENTIKLSKFTSSKNFSTMGFCFSSAKICFPYGGCSFHRFPNNKFSGKQGPRSLGPRAFTEKERRTSKLPDVTPSRMRARAF